MQRIIGAALSLAMATGVAACSDGSPSGPDDPIPNAPVGMVVSNAQASSVRASALVARNSLAVSASTVAYVSAVPGTFPTALSLAIRNESNGSTTGPVKVIDGGFDPVGIDAKGGDALSLAVTMVGGGSTVVSVKVPPRRPPSVVRTSPSKGRTDVALNVQVEVVFSEPVDASSVTASSFALRRGATVVSGKMRVSTDGLSATFIPDGSLDPQTTYSLTIAGGIRDLDGDPLGEEYVVSFTTSVATIAGTLEVSVFTSGSDQDADGYTLSAQDRSREQYTRLAVTDTHTFTGTEPGDVSVVLYGLAPNCSVIGPNPRVANVKSDETAHVSYGVNCVASGSIRVTTVTTGAAPDFYGYFMTDRDRSTLNIGHSFTAGLDLNLPPNGTTTASALIPGNYVVDIWNVAPNCNAALPGARTISIAAGVETSFKFEVTCGAPTQIAFVRGGAANRDDWANPIEANTDIYLINSDGTGTIRLTSEAGADINPAWSPDGRKIAFASDRAGNREIYVMNADGTDPLRLTNHDAADYGPAYSPDGKRIAFTSERDGNPEIYVMNADGTNLSRLTNDPPASAMDPAWSPDGNKIAFRSQRIGSTWHVNIYVMNDDGSGATALTNFDSYTSPGAPAWSPDGRTIAFPGGGNAISLMNADGSEIRRFLSGGTSTSSPDWSPDGSKLAFDDNDCWDFGPCPRAIVIGWAGGQYSSTIEDASEPAWRPR